MCFKLKKSIAAATPAAPAPVKKVDQTGHHDFVATAAVEEVNLMDQFAKDRNLDGLIYRKGAAFTAAFGIDDSWGPNWEPGYIRIHPGVDRSGGGSLVNNGNTINDVVICPLDFDSSDTIYFGPKVSYGFLVIFTDNEYGFDMRIAHMSPNNSFIPWSLNQIKAHKPFKQGWTLGSAGTFGYSTGAHTHTELISHGETCEVFEQFLKKQFGEDVNKEFTDEFVIAEYKKRAAQYPNTSPYVKWSNDQIRQDWLSLKKAKNVMFINKYKYVFYWDDGKHHTRYATNMVFKGL